jgi:anti-sigma factor RsiW
MQNSYLNHPAEEALERFLLHQCPEEELETIETHILGCHGCVSRLEALESEIAAMKIALRELQPQQVAAAARQRHSWKTWFTVPNLSWAGVAAAIVAAGLIVTPQMMRQSASPADITLSANRGVERAAVPEGRPLHVRFDAPGLPEGRVGVQLVNETGTELWKGVGRVSRDKAEATAPKISQPGTYFFRLYSTGKGESDELLREFAFQVK